MFSELESAVLNLLKDSFVDSGNTLQEEFVSMAFKGLIKEESDGEDSASAGTTATESAWIVNQRSICFNLPALATFLEERSFFALLFPHLQSL